MKKIIIIAVMAMVAATSAAKLESIGEYDMSFFHKSYLIKMGEAPNGGYSFYVESEPRGDDDTFVAAIFNTKKNDIISQMEQIKGKYQEWSKIAKDNNIVDYVKAFDMKLKGIPSFIWLNDAQVAFETDYDVIFHVSSTGDCRVSISVGEIKAFNNRFITCNGMMLVFSSVEEIDNFIKIMKDGIATAQAKKEEKTKTDKLFN